MLLNTELIRRTGSSSRQICCRLQGTQQRNLVKPGFAGAGPCHPWPRCPTGTGHFPGRGPLQLSRKGGEKVEAPSFASPISVSLAVSKGEILSLLDFPLSTGQVYCLLILFSQPRSPVMYYLLRAGWQKKRLFSCTKNCPKLFFNKRSKVTAAFVSHNYSWRGSCKQKEVYENHSPLSLCPFGL